MTRAYQARIQSLAELDGRRGYVALPDAGAMGTNKAFINKADGAGQSTKAPTQSLYQESFEQVRRCRWLHGCADLATVFRRRSVQVWAFGLRTWLQR